MNRRSAAVPRGGRSRRPLLAGIVAFGLAALTACGGSNGNDKTGEKSQVGYFDGKTITIIVPFGPGGAVDTFGRFVGEYLPKFLEGEPKITVRNVEGGGGLVGWNQYERADKDGLTLMLGSGTPHALYAYGAQGVEYDLATKKPLIGTQLGTVMYASKDIGTDDPAKLLEPNVKDLHIGGITPNGNALLKVMPLHVLKARFKVTWGYETAAAHRVAFQQGETNVDSQSTPAYINEAQPAAKEEGSFPLFSLGQIKGGELVRDPQLPDLPHVGEVYEQIYGKAPEGPLWEAYKSMVAMGHSLGPMVWVHGDAPKEALDELNQAAAKLKSDPKFLAAADELLGGYPLLVGEELQELVDLYLLNPDPATIDYLIDFVKKEYDVQLDGPVS